MCKISVIIPCYNAADTITESLKSLECQTFKDFEIVIIDDGSWDGSLETIKKYIKKSKMVINLQRQKNQGVSIARNNGLKVAKGKYVAFLDADDEYTPDFLEILYYSIGDKDIAFCKYAFKTFNEKDYFNVFATPTIELLNKGEILNAFYHKRKEHIGFWSGLYRKSILIQFDIKFPVGIKYGEDSQFFCTYVYYCQNGGVYVKSEKYKYILRDTSVMNNKTYDKVQNIQVYKNIAKLWKNDIYFSCEMEKSLVARAIWSVAKDFAIDNREYFIKLQKEHDVKGAMKIMRKNADEMLIRISAFAFLISPDFFYWLVRKRENYRRHNYDIPD